MPDYEIRDDFGRKVGTIKEVRPYDGPDHDGPGFSDTGCGVMLIAFIIVEVIAAGIGSSLLPNDGGVIIGPIAGLFVFAWFVAPIISAIDKHEST